MKKVFSAILVAVLCICLFAGCVGTTVVIGECDHVTPAPTAAPDTSTTDDTDLPGSTLSTGLAMVTTLSDSTSAAADAEGAAKYEIVVAAVALDYAGVIRACSLDSVPATVNFDTKGAITTDLASEIRTKNEQGADYGMVAWGGAIAEWDAQAAALCDFAIGKTVAEFKASAIDASGRAPDGSDLASSATIYLGGYVSAIEAAAAKAQPTAAAEGDEMILVTTSDIADSTSATAEKDGTAQLYTTAAVLTHKNGVITSCYIDAVQAKVSFDASGTITSDLAAPVLTKNEQGSDYGMVAWGGAIAEWDAQAASFCDYIIGKTAAEVSGIAVTESTKPADGSDLASSVTISIGGFQALINKALA